MINLWFYFADFLILMTELFIRFKFTIVDFQIGTDAALFIRQKCFPNFSRQKLNTFTDFFAVEKHKYV